MNRTSSLLNHPFTDEFERLFAIRAEMKERGDAAELPLNPGMNRAYGAFAQGTSATREMPTFHTPPSMRASSPPWPVRRSWTPFA